MLQRPASTEFAPYYGKYIDRVPDGDVVATLREQIDETLTFLRGISDETALTRYAPGKWSIKEVIGHLCDAERVFVYRALRFARADATPLPGFDENTFVANARFDDRGWDDLLSEYAAVRRATVAFFGSLHPDEWARSGTANDKQMSVRAIAYVVAGHERHHAAIIRERYLK